MFIKKDTMQKAPANNLMGIYLTLVLLLFSVTTQAQCAMCRAALESQGDSTKAEAVNDGIVYLMVVPYLLVGIIGYVVYRTGKNMKKDKP